MFPAFFGAKMRTSLVALLLTATGCWNQSSQVSLPRLPNSAEEPELIGGPEWEGLVAKHGIEVLSEFAGNRASPGQSFKTAVFSIGCDGVAWAGGRLVVTFTATNSSDGPLKPNSYLHDSLDSNGGKFKESGDIDYSQFGVLLPGESRKISMELVPANPLAARGVARFITGEFGGKDGTKNTRWTLDFAIPPAPAD